jgi:hypothetical protein
MRKTLLSLCCTILLLGAPLMAQPTSPGRGISSTGTIPGSGCAFGPAVWKSSATTGLYQCSGGHYVAISGGGSGTVTSVAATVPSFMTLSGSPVTTSGTLAFDFSAQSGRKFLASPSDGTSGVLALRAIDAADVPTLNQATTNTAGGLSGTALGGDVTNSGNTITVAKVNGSTPGGTCTNQFVTSISSSAVPTCTTDTLASAQHANQGTTTTVLHGNAAGNPSFGSVVSADLNITTTTCTNQFLTAISSSAGGTCTTDTLASAQHANQGTTTTLLHGNAAGNPSFGSVVSGDLNITTTTCTNQFLRAITSSAGGTCESIADADTTGITKVGKVTLTQPATAATITVLNNKTLTANNSITLAGTDSTTMTFPTTTATIARTDAAQTFTGTQTFDATSFSSGIQFNGKSGVSIGSSSSNILNLNADTTISFNTSTGGSTAVTITTTSGSAAVTMNTANSASWTHGQASESMTLSTSGTTTDSAANLLPANARIESVDCRIITTITTATNWSVGDATIAARFSAANSTLTSGTTSVGLAHIDQTGTSGPRQTAAAKLRITTTGTPGAGVIRCTVFYDQFAAPVN